MELREYLRRGGLAFPNLTARELDNLSCRIQTGLQLSDALQEVFPPPPFVHLLTQIPDSVLARQADVRSVYAAYGSLCDSEWNWAGSTWNKLKDSDDFNKVGGQAEYPKLRYYYYRRGVTDPPKTLDQIQLSQRFLGEIYVTGGLHPLMVKVLESAERRIRGFPLVGKFLIRSIVESIPATKKGKRAIGGWFPRPIANGGLSAHAVGLAVDINAAENPHLKDKNASAIDAILDELERLGEFPAGIRLRSGLTDLSAIQVLDAGARSSVAATAAAFEIWMKLNQISSALRGFLGENLEPYEQGRLTDSRRPPLIRNLAKAMGGIERLRTIAERGVYDQRLALVIGMLQGGAKYGGEFKSHKDEHHFEYRDWEHLFKPPACIEK
jgi:hypothetical protein